MPTITVKLGSRSYPILLENGILARVGEELRARLGDAACAVVTDDHVAPLYLPTVEASLRAAGLRCASMVLPHGEQTKCMARLSELYGFLAESRITRKDVVIALGGGVIGDLTGLAAATWLRGVRFVQLPTTLLSQVDSSVGGKVAVDLPQGKNLVGAFHQPSLVLCDPQTLTTLTDDFWRDGLGEVVKYGCIGEASLFRLLEEAAPGGREAVMARIGDIVACCIRHKAQVVEQDELDTGLRVTLNFGHTLGHAVETCQHYTGFSHGEAVAMGMAVITRLTEAKGMTVPGTAQRLIRLLTALGLPTELPALPEEALLSAMTMDKKSSGDQLTVLVLKDIGHCYAHKTDRSFFQGVTSID